MKLNKVVKEYLEREIIKETTSGYDYRMIDGKRQKINREEIPEDCIVICNSSAAYRGRIVWNIWFKDPANKYFDIYTVRAIANLNEDWHPHFNYYSRINNLIYIGTRHYADKTAVEIFYNTVTEQLEGGKLTAYWSEAKHPIEMCDKTPSLRSKDSLSIRNFYEYQTTASEKRPLIRASKANDNWSQHNFSSEIRQIISDVYDLRKFKEAYPNGIEKPQDLIDFLKFDDKDLERRAKNRENNANCIAEYEKVMESFETANTAIKIKDKIYFNDNNRHLYVQNLKTGTLVDYTSWNNNIMKAAVPKNGAICAYSVFDQVPRDILFKGCFDENGKQISFAECFGKQSNVTIFFDYYDAPKRADVILNLFTIRGKYGKILELAIKSKNKFLIQKIIERKVLEKEQYNKKSYWNRENFLCFDGTKTNIPQMLNTNKYIVNQIKDLDIHQDVRVIDTYVKLSTLFNNLSIKDFMEINSNEGRYSLAFGFDEHEEVFKLFAKDGLQTFKKRLAAYGENLRRYKDYLNMRQQLQTLSATDSTVVFNSNEWPLFPEAAIKHVTLYLPRNYYNTASIDSIISSYTRFTLCGVEFSVLSKTKEQAILELHLNPMKHLIYLEAELTKVYNIYRDKAKNEAFKHSIERLKAYEFSDGQLSIVAPTQASDLTTEGAVLHHCVGSFIDAVANNKENVVFIRRNDLLNEPYYTMAISPSGNIEQIHCVYNGDLTAEGQERAYKATQREVYREKFDLIKFLKQWVAAMRKKGLMINPNTIQLSYGALGAHN
jgi:hypothetical protein